MHWRFCMYSVYKVMAAIVIQFFLVIPGFASQEVTVPTIKIITSDDRELEIPVNQAELSSTLAAAIHFKQSQSAPLVYTTEADYKTMHYVKSVLCIIEEIQQKTKTMQDLVVYITTLPVLERIYLFRWAIDFDIQLLKKTLISSLTQPESLTECCKTKLRDKLCKLPQVLQKELVATIIKKYPGVFYAGFDPLVTYGNYSATVTRNQPIKINCEETNSKLFVPFVDLEGDQCSACMLDLYSLSREKIAKPGMYITSICLSLDSQLLAFACNDKVYIHNTITKELIAKHDVHTSAVKFIQFINKKLITACSDMVVIFDSETQDKSIIYVDHINHISFSHDQLVISKDASAKVYNLQGYFCSKEYVHNKPIASAYSSGNGTKLLTCADGMVSVWDMHSKVIIHTLKSNIKFKKALYNSDETIIMAVTENNKLQLFDAQTYEVIMDINGAYWDFNNPEMTIDNNVIISNNDKSTIDIANLSAITAMLKDQDLSIILKKYSRSIKK